MKAVILAAGEGKRLRPYTEDRPKCMVEYKGKPIINYTLDAMEKCGLKDIAVVSGYQREALIDHLKDKKVSHLINKKFAVTNMVYTLFCAEDYMDDDIIISYSDIVYSPEILQKLIDAEGGVCVVSDKDWRTLWEKRMDDPLSDAETFKVRDGKIVELGKKPKSYDDIEGQYIGLIKISKEMIPQIKKYYHELDKSAVYDGKDFNNMYMTSFIQMIIDNLADVYPVFINGGWVEIDSVEDLERL